MSIRDSAWENARSQSARMRGATAPSVDSLTEWTAPVRPVCHEKSTTSMPSQVPDGARELAIETARDAGALLRERLTQPRNVQFKGTVDLVTDSDQASEALIAQRIRDAFPEHRLIGEEGARGAGPGPDTPEGSDGTDDPSRFGWVVDPLDGTTNYAHGYPHFAVSIGLECEGAVILGVVYDPMRDELFVAERGGGATLNGAPIAVSSQDELLRSLLATGFPYDLTQRQESDDIWLALNRACQGVRRDGSAALNLCYVACWAGRRLLGAAIAALGHGRGRDHHRRSRGHRYQLSWRATGIPISGRSSPATDPCTRRCWAQSRTTPHPTQPHRFSATSVRADAILTISPGPKRAFVP